MGRRDGRSIAHWLFPVLSCLEQWPAWLLRIQSRFLIVAPSPAHWAQPELLELFYDRVQRNQPCAECSSLPLTPWWEQLPVISLLHWDKQQQGNRRKKKDKAKPPTSLQEYCNGLPGTFSVEKIRKISQTKYTVILHFLKCLWKMEF